ncbi:MAG TPA: glycosyltransferase family 4 protein [Bacteroidales bacterium]|nr:glycosyltransferase family 4 protein [Bacteroidales bacterium]
MAYKVLFLSDISRAPFTSVADRMLVRGLSQKGVEITVLTPRPSPETIEIEREGVKVEYLPLEKKISLKGIRRLRELLKEGNFDLLHCTYSKAVTNGLIAARGMKVKSVAYYGSLSLHWHDPSAWLAFLNPRIDKIICPSDAVEAHIKKQLPAKRRDRTVRIYRGYDPSWLEGIEPVGRGSLGVSEDEFLICTVGNLRKVKGVQYLIKAVGYLPADMPVKVLLVGSGTDSVETRRLTEETGRPEWFILQGHVPLSPAYVAPCDLYIQPSLSEGLGRAISEAMCLAKPVIVTDGGGAKEFFAGGDNGFVVKKGSPEAIADAIVHCYKNRNSLSLIGIKARESMMTTFNFKHTVSKTYDVYRELLG